MKNPSLGCPCPNHATAWTLPLLILHVINMDPNAGILQGFSPCPEAAAKLLLPPAAIASGSQWEPGKEAPGQDRLSWGETIQKCPGRRS